MKKKWKVIIISSVCFSVVVGIGAYITCFPYIFRYIFDSSKFNITEKETSNDIKIMTYNARGNTTADKYKRSWFYRAKLQFKLIEEEKPDIIGFQECSPIMERYYKRHFKGYDFKEPYDKKKSERGGNLIIYRSDIFSKQAEGFFYLSNTPEKKSKDWGSNNYRTCSYVTLQNKDTEKVYNVINVHLDHKSKEARENQTRVLLEQIYLLNLKNPLILGDFNSGTRSSPFAQLTEAGLHDSLTYSLTPYEGNGTTFHKYGEYLNNGRIDYIFVDPSITVNSYNVIEKKIDGEFPSDHNPVVINIAK